MQPTRSIRARVYVAGLSAGGAMADILGRRYPDLFAAVGVHSGLPAGAASDLDVGAGRHEEGGHAKGARPADARRPSSSTATPTPRCTRAMANRWSRPRSPGSRQPPAPQEASGTSTRGRTFTRRTYASAEGRGAVEHWVLHGAGHAWAGGSSQGSFTDPSGPDASAEMLRFFLSHPHPSATTVQ